MIYVLLLFWVISAILTIKTQRLVRIVVYLGVFSAISAACFFALGAPDVAMAEVAVSAFLTIFLIICFEKYFSLVANAPTSENKNTATAATEAKAGEIMELAAASADTGKIGDVIAENLPSAINAATSTAKADNSGILKRVVFPVCFTVFLLVLFMFNMPDSAANTFLRDLYLANYRIDIGGQNAVTSIYLGYRIYDTLFEALMLLIAAIGVSHMSWFSDQDKIEGTIEAVPKPGAVDIYTIRIICPIILLFGIYLVFNGHISPGGGFQGGAAVASFFICRYMIHSVSNVRLNKIMVMEKITFVAIVLLAIFFIFLGVYIHFPEFRTIYMIMMNLLIALKVAFGYTIIFYRYIAFERR